jgi:hypothetical protein
LIGTTPSRATKVSDAKSSRRVRASKAPTNAETGAEAPSKVGKLNQRSTLLVSAKPGLTAQVKASKRTTSAKAAAPQASQVAPKETPKEVKPIPVFQENAFDLTVQQLPPLYFGASVSEITKALTDLQNAKKDQYETTAEYQTRFEALKSKPVFNKIRYEDMIALPIQEPVMGRTYNADKGMMSLNVHASSRIGTVLRPSGFKLDRSRIILRLRQESERKKATFTNAYGASWEGTDINATVWNAFVPSYTPSAIDFPLPSDEARSLKDAKLVAILVGTLSSREVVESGTSSKATLKDPTSFFQLDQSVSFDPKELWIYVLETGKVLNRVKIEPTPLSRMGVTLAQESFPLLQFSILTPCDFKDDDKTFGKYPNTISVKTKVAQVPGVTVIVSETSNEAPAGDADMKLEDSMAEYEKGTHPVEKAISDREILGVPAKTMLAKVKNGGHTFIERSAAFVLPDYAGRKKLIFVVVKVDAAIDQAGAEVERIFNSLSKTR